jgi:hypothetical protein
MMNDRRRRDAGSRGSGRGTGHARTGGEPRPRLAEDVPRVPSHVLADLRSSAPGHRVDDLRRALGEGQSALEDGDVERAVELLRWAKTQGADDAMWVSADGYALEGPTSSLLWLDGETLCTTPTWTGILPGTTCDFLMRQAESIGLSAEERLIRVEDLYGVEAAWLTSSVRGVAFITTLDGKPVSQRADVTAELDKLAGFEVPS